jgi:hypothetical protein
MSDFWVKELEKASRDKAIADFKIGWLMSCLRTEGWSNDKINAELEQADAKANFIFKK